MTLNLTEMFASIQGESSYTGIPFTFIRLAACNLRCTWCDTPYSFGRGIETPLQAIIDQVKTYGCKHVCITGGEPLLQQEVHTLMSRLLDLNYQLTLETGGSLDTSSVDPRVVVILDIKCPKSGMQHKNLWKNLSHLKSQDEVKFVIQDEEDYAFAKEVCKKNHLFSREKMVLFSPVHGLLDPKQLTEWILKDKICARLNLQIHKYIWSPETQGV